MKKWLYALAGFLVVVGFSILGRDERRAKKAGAQRDALLVDGSKAAKEKAKKAGEKADKLQAQAAEAAKVGEAVVNDVGSNNETIASVLDGWRKPDGV